MPHLRGIEQLGLLAEEPEIIFLSRPLLQLTIGHRYFDRPRPSELALDPVPLDPLTDLVEVLEAQTLQGSYFARETGEAIGNAVDE